MLYVKPAPDVDILFTIVTVYLSAFFSHSCCLPVSGEIKLYIYNVGSRSDRPRLPALATPTPIRYALLSVVTIAPKTLKFPTNRQRWELVN